MSYLNAGGEGIDQGTVITTLVEYSTPGRSSSDESCALKIEENKAASETVSKSDGISDDFDEEIAVLVNLIDYDAPYCKELDDEVITDMGRITAARDHWSLVEECFPPMAIEELVIT
ncbi:hypothetical protein BJ508DRAFT_315668 [Ascobolus immersus RN42]|uniref:Uncharacterized protein n=1 Tax=Ascobolus immersus RN42 TaxID=1160509 RepID=A0A3N4H9U2_ASCIM|nr:hypothetical protein BJ508DRAFT_315668 [Ascobolus immersus RN42]